MPKRIAVCTSSRADYSHLYWPLKAIDQHPELEYELIVFGAHTSHEFGQTVAEIRNDGFNIAGAYETLVSSDSDVGMAKSLGMATLALADHLASSKPDIVLVIADRYEMLAVANVAITLRIPMAHIEGGDISAGAIDDAVRNALTKMSHLHFTPHSDAAQRVESMGEAAWRVVVAGAPSLDHIPHLPQASRSTLGAELAVNFADELPLVVAAVHPVTLEQDATLESNAFFDALNSLDANIVFCFPNADCGSRSIAQKATEFCATHPHAHLFTNLPASTYLSLLSVADAMVGNSSSGIMEAASFELPALDVGRRQDGRLRGKNVVTVAADSQSIQQGLKKILSKDFRESLAGMENPYGDGHASERITSTLARSPNRETLLDKRESL